jgi:hypothetical protein
MSQTNENQSPTGSRRAIVEKSLTVSRWDTESKGFCRCPGEAKHTTKTGDTDTMINIDGVATLFCLHQACAEEVADENREIRRVIREGDPNGTFANDKERKKWEEKQDELVRKERRARSSRTVLLRDYAWPVDKVIAASAVPLTNIPLEQHSKLLMKLFQPEDVVWIGNKTDSGSQVKAVHFKTAAEWLASNTPPLGELTCPASFKEGTFSRSNDQVAAKRFLVVESDVLSKDDTCAIFRWLDKAVELPLRAIVDTGGKSVHGWFVYPPTKHLDELKIVLPVLGCDAGMFTLSQPVRLPGVIRQDTGRPQQLIYLSKEVSL